MSIDGVKCVTMPAIKHNLLTPVYPMPTISRIPGIKGSLSIACLKVM